MKSACITLVIFVIAMTASSVFGADTTSPKPEADKTFEQLKILGGSWESDDPKNPLTVKFRLTSNGSALLSEMFGERDNMITMFHLDDGRLMATHYCAAGNQPRMIGKLLPDGKSVEFDFIDGTNLNSTNGYMHGLVIGMIDDTHHSEDLIFQTKDGKHQKVVHFNMHRTQ
jgi:hypothetical protein